MHQARRILVVLYAASGAAALVYEVTWTRLLTLQLGHTVAAASTAPPVYEVPGPRLPPLHRGPPVAAASTVLAAFMGGLAVGAWAAGSVVGDGVQTIPSPLRPLRSTAVTRFDGMRAYAALEI